MRLEGRPAAIQRPAPGLGEQTGEILEASDTGAGELINLRGGGLGG